jgi:predicted nucleic acid-binding protein
MPTYYLDASAIVKRYVSEMGSAWVQALSSNEENTLVMGEIALAEVASAFARAARDGRISNEERLSYLDLFIGDCAERYRLVAIERTIIDRAVDLTQSHCLRGYDAVHLATALAVNAELLRKHLLPLTFVAADEDLLKAAEAEGLVAENPNSYP